MNADDAVAEHHELVEWARQQRREWMAWTEGRHEPCTLATWHGADMVLRDVLGKLGADDD